MPRDKDGHYCWIIWQWADKCFVPLYFMAGCSRDDAVVRLRQYGKAHPTWPPFGTMPEGADLMEKWMRKNGFRIAKTRLVATFDTTRK